jgi:uncharacterized protein YydD (DUF2326 family)
MLVEIRCDKFISHGAVRPPIRFGKGLNSVQGSQTGSNSIGKSTILMIIDFCLGGEDYVLKSTDVQAEIGAHTIEFMFRFGDKEYRFSRNTVEAATIHVCDENYRASGAEHTLEQYKDWLNKQYDIALPQLSFRDAVGRYIRVYGRENLSERRPLLYAHGEKEEAAITALMKLFNAFSPIAALRDEEKRCNDEKSATLKAQKFNLVPSINKTQVKKNIKEIAELEKLLRTLESGNEAQQLKALGIGGDEADKVLELKKLLASARRQRSRLKNSLYAVESNMGISRESGFDEVYSPTSSFSGGNNPASASFKAFAGFFPEANIKKIEQIQGFHQQLQAVLHAEFSEAQAELNAMIALADAEIARLEKEIIQSGIPIKMSKANLEKYSATDSRIKALERENKAHQELAALKDRSRLLAAQLVAMLSEQLGVLQQSINGHMGEINTFIYGANKTAPIMTLSANGKSYTFETPRDKGTGVQYKGLLVFDISVLELTALPLLVHDSVLFKHVADEPLEKIFERYAASDKQVFVTIDKVSSYTPRLQEIVKTTTVLELSDGSNELFGRSWNVKEEAAKTEAVEAEPETETVEAETIEMETEDNSDEVE